MYPLERQQHILKILYEDGRLDVSDLSRRMHVSEVTIRKDLEKLEGEGVLQRTHGGAILAVPLSRSPVNHSEDQMNEVHIKQIARIAAELVRSNSSVFIGAGRICLEAAMNLSHKDNLSIVTNNLQIATDMPVTNNVRILLTGGERRENKGSLFLSGPRTADFLNDIFVDYAIITVDGIHLERGYTIGNYDDDRSYITSINNAREILIVADSTKFDHISFSKIADINMKCKIISDEQAPKKYLEYYFMNNIPIYTSYELIERPE